ncbi:MAG: ECF transporter S component [Eubacterium sp.]|nr:ECF transporter S component [Eubacterium sp.]
MEERTKKITITAVFAALIFVATVVLPIPIPATGGYVNLGDAIILLAVWNIGGKRAGIAAAVGAGLADLFLAPSYAPGTLVIKFLMAIAAYGIYKLFSTANLHKSITWIVSAFASEVIMIVGYLFYEGVILGLGYGALAGVSGNVLQGGLSIAIAFVLIQTLEATKIADRLLKTV